eukprot:TRINITY_DN31517_c0_g1_i1.p1 TRINITY_DN31517_c0_g1~~TRINITY_DN31517_c0_g1_i1.p1  ORF type:complete len:557 (+),score=164.48 TRINITY_DN31517_c0_g1_i1:62-1732(+)
MAVPAGYPASKDPESAAAVSSLLQAGAKAHQAGHLQIAEDFYVKALAALGLSALAEQRRVVTTGTASKVQESILLGLRPSGNDAAELLHLLGALRVQRLQNGENPEDSDDEDEEAEGGAAEVPDEEAAAAAEVAAHIAAEELAAAVILLRAGLLALPEEEPAPKRARILSSLGLALLQKPRKKKGPGADSRKEPDPKNTEAAELLREATRLDKGRWAAWFNLSRALKYLMDEKERQDKMAEVKSLSIERIEALKAARKIRPKHLGVLYRLGFAQKERANSEEAAGALEAYLEIVEDEQTKQAVPKSRIAGVRHWLAVLRGETTASAPGEYVAGLFDSYADKFDEHLVNKLGYRTPELLKEEIRSASIKLNGPECVWASLRRCADLGCGTGLMGPLLKELGTEYLIGVDLSSGMLQKAREKKRGYDELVCGDLLDVFEEKDGKCPEYDLVVAADVFVYVGDLKPALAATAQCLAKPNGLAAFSTEAPPRAGSANEGEGSVPEGGFKLAETGRYMHTSAYVSNTAEACGLTLYTRKDVVLRMNGGKPVYGHLHVFRHA